MTDADFMLAVLRERPGEYVAQRTILERSIAERGCGMTVHSRASTLRERGHVIECQVRPTCDGRRASFYRFVEPSLCEAESSPRALAAAFGSASQSEGLARPGSMHVAHHLSAESEEPSLTLFEPSARREVPAWA